MINFLLDLLTFLAIISSVLVITSKNPVIAVIFLISVFINTYHVLSTVIRALIIIGEDNIKTPSRDVYNLAGK